MDKQVVCWHCGGRKVCQVCRGSGYFPFWYAAGQVCYNCKGKGECMFCLPQSASDYEKDALRPKRDKHLGGYNIYGASCIRHPDQRP